MKTTHLILISITFLLCASHAHAVDSTGESGEIETVQFVTPFSDSYIQFHGRLFVKSLSDDEIQEYRWGGTSCGGTILSEQELNRLFDLSTAPYMLVTPYYQDGQGVTRCLVSLAASNRKYN